MTVSRALSNHPNVQKETRDTILKHARALGYVKSAAAKAMRGDQTKIVGLLLPNIVNEFYARFANTMALACEDASLQLIIHLTNDDISAEEQALERLHEIQAQAVVLVPSPGESISETPHLRSMRVIQLIRQRELDLPNDTILVADSPALSQSVCQLASEGHLNIAYIGAGPELSSGRARLKAYKTGLTESGIRLNNDLVCLGDPSHQMGSDFAQHILDKTQATALICAGFEISNGALQAIMDNNLDPTKAFGFIGYGDPSFYSWINGGISTIQVPVDQLAQKAVALLTAPADRTTSSEYAFEAKLILRR